MQKEQKKNDTVTFRVPSKLLNEFKAVAENEDRPASQVLRDLMRFYIKQNATVQ